MRIDCICRVAASFAVLVAALLLHYSGDSFWIDILRHYSSIIREDDHLEKVSGEALLRSGEHG